MQLGSLDALVTNITERGPGQMQGMGDPGGLVPGIIDSVSGGEYTRITRQLDTLELALKISIVASVIAGTAGLLVLLKGR